MIADPQDMLNAGIRHLGRTVRPIDDARDATLLLVNLNATDSDQIVECEPWTDQDMESPRLLPDEDGTPAAFQRLPAAAETRGFQRLAFRVRVPGFGRRLLRFAKDAARGTPPASLRRARPLPRDERRLETAGWRLDLDAATGAVLSLVNKASGQPIFSGLAHRYLVVDDPTDTWSHGIDRFAVLGEDAILEGLVRLEDGPVRRAIEVTALAGASRFKTTILLPDDADLPVELRVGADWREQRRLLRIAYPLAASSFECEVPAGWSARPDDGREAPRQRWVRTVSERGVVALVNDAKYSYAALGGTLYLTAVRAPVFAHHGPVVLAEGVPYAFMDQGPQTFTVRIQAGDRLSRTDAARLADDLLQPSVSTPHVGRGGTATWCGQWLEARVATGAITALKVAEDGRGLIIRAVELEGAPGTLIVGSSEVAIRPRGLVTARLDGDAFDESDGLER